VARRVEWGYTVTGTGATIDPAFPGASTPGTSAERSQPNHSTGGTADTISIANRVAIDYSAGGRLLTRSVTVTPNYT
jgi:hypothetical protein